MDVLGDAPPIRFAKAVDIVIKDEEVDAVLVILTPQAMTNATSTAKEIVNIAEKNPKLIIAAFLGGASMYEAIYILLKAGIPAYRTPEEAIQAFMKLVEYSRNLQQLYETPKEISLEFKINRQLIRDKFLELIPKNSSLLSEYFSKMLLEEYGILTAFPYKAKEKNEAAIIADKLGYPVVMKIDSPDIIHKSDVGGVVLNLNSTQEVINNFDWMIERVNKNAPDAKIDGVTIQHMFDTNKGIELLLGSKKDNIFGSIILIGMGGLKAEIFADLNIGLPPLNERLAKALLEPLKVYKLLQGYRQEFPKNVNKLLEIIIRFSYLIADFPEILEKWILIHFL